MEQDIGELVRRVRAGEPDTFTLLYRATSRRVYWLASKIMRNETDAEDIVQQVYLKIFQNLDALEDTQAARAWIDQITRNTCLTELKKRDRREAQTEEDEGAISLLEEENESYLPEGYVDNQASREIVMALIDALPEAQARTVYLYYFSELSVQQIAQEMGISEGTVKSRLSAARAKLRAGVEEEERKGIKLFAFPALGALLRQDAESCVPPQALETVVSQQIAQLTALSGGAAAGRGLGAMLRGMSTGAKILAVAVAGAVVIGGGLLVYQAAQPSAPPNGAVQTERIVGVEQGVPTESPAPLPEAAPTPAPTEAPAGPNMFVPEELVGKSISELIALYGEADTLTDSGVWDCYGWKAPQLIANTDRGGETIRNFAIYSDIPLHGVTPGDSLADMQAAWSDLEPITEPFPSSGEGEGALMVYLYQGGGFTYQADVEGETVFYTSVYPEG